MGVMMLDEKMRAQGDGEPRAFSTRNFNYLERPRKRNRSMGKES